MSKTKGDIRSIYLRYLDEATKKGVDLPITKNADYRDKFDYFLDSANKYISTIIKLPSVYQLTQFPVNNLMGLLQGFDARVIYPSNATLINGNDFKSPYQLDYKGMQSYSFEVNQICTINFKENIGGTWTTIKTINNATKGTFTAYKGNLTLTSTSNLVRFEVIATYPTVIKNTGFYEVLFPTDNDVPEYNPYVSYDMPSDFLEFDSVVIRSDPRVYEQYVAYKWENNKKVILNYYDKGSFDIHYFKYPADILPTDADSTIVEVEEKAVDLLALQVGIDATAADNPSLSSWLRSLFIERVQNVAGNSKISETTVQTIYSMN